MFDKYFVPVMCSNKTNDLLLDLPLIGSVKDVISGNEVQLIRADITENGLQLNDYDNNNFAAYIYIADTILFPILISPNANITFEADITLQQWTVSTWQGAADFGFSDHYTRESSIGSYFQILGPYYSGDPKQLLTGEHKLKTIYTDAEAKFTYYIDGVNCGDATTAKLSDNANKCEYLGFAAGKGKFLMKNLKIYSNG